MLLFCCCCCCCRCSVPYKAGTPWKFAGAFYFAHCKWKAYVVDVDVVVADGLIFVVVVSCSH